MLTRRAEIRSRSLHYLTAKRLSLARFECGKHLPKLIGDERSNFPFALDHQSHSYRLHTSRRQPACDFGPQQWRNHKTHDAIKEASGLLRFDIAHIKLTRLGEGILDCTLCNLVEHNALVATFIAANGFFEMPSDCLSLAVQICCEIDCVGCLSQLLKLRYHLLFTGQHFIPCGPIMVWINPHALYELLSGLFLFIGYFLIRCEFSCLCCRSCTRFGVYRRRGTGGRQVADVSHTRFDDKVRTEVFVNSFRLGGRFDYY